MRKSCPQHKNICLERQYYGMTHPNLDAVCHLVWVNSYFETNFAFLFLHCKCTHLYFISAISKDAPTVLEEKNSMKGNRCTLRSKTIPLMSHQSPKKYLMS